MPQVANQPGVTPALDRLVTVDQVAEWFSLTPQTIGNLVERGQFPPPKRIGRRIVRWSVPELRDWLEAGCPEARR